MINIGGFTMDALQSPLSSLAKARDLIYFEGPILSHYVSDNKLEDWLFLWVDTNKEVDRWLLFEITPGELSRYMKREMPLLHLLRQPKSKVVFAHDVIRHSQAVDQITVVNPDSLPENYLPTEDSFFDYDLAPFDEYVTYGLIELNGDWSLFNFSSFATLFNKVYAFAYTLTQQTVYDIISEYPWRGGYSQIGFFNRLQRIVDTPPINVIRYASPGYLSLDVDQASAKNLEYSLLGYMQNKTEIESAYNEVLDFVKEQNLNTNRILENQIIANLNTEQIESLSESLIKLSSCLNLSSLVPEQRHTDGRVFGRTKAFMAYIRLLRDLEVFHTSGLARLSYVRNALETVEPVEVGRNERQMTSPEDLPF